MKQSDLVEKRKPFLFRSENRYLWYILIFPAFFACFFGVQAFNVHAIFTVDLPIDRMIPFFKYFILCYFLWYLLLAVTGVYLLIRDHEGFKRYATYFGIACGTALVIYVLIPSQQTLRDMCDLSGSDLCTRMLSFIHSVDVNRNVCPSLHVVGTFAALYSLFTSPTLKKKWIKIALILFSVLICLSTLFVKQHGIVDILLALPYSILFYYVVFYGIFKPRRRHFDAG